MTELCPDCNHPVGWDQLRGECPRPMQNFQSDACKERQVEWLKQKLAASEQLSADLVGGLQFFLGDMCNDPDVAPYYIELHKMLKRSLDKAGG